MKIKEKNEIRIGDFITNNERKIRVTRVDEGEGVSGGLLDHFKWDEVNVPRLDDDFFERNGFKKSRAKGVVTYSLGNEVTSLEAIKREKFYDVHIRNKVYEFSGPVDSLNHLLHILESCSIVNDFIG